jgi:hypothetical protein
MARSTKQSSKQSPQGAGEPDTCSDTYPLARVFDIPPYHLMGNDGLSRICACPTPSQRDCQLRGLSNHQHAVRYRGSIAVAIACLVNDTSSGPTKMRRLKCLQLVQCLPNSDFEGTSRLATETFPIAKVARGYLYIHRSGKMFLQCFPQARGD